MGAVRMCARAVLRRKVWGTVAVALLVGIAGTAVLGAFAGARRTDSAFPRLLAAERVGDISVGPQALGVVPAAAIRRLPHVESVDALHVFILASRHRGPIVFQRDLGAASAIGSPSPRPLYQTQKVQVLDGKLPDPTRVDEALVNEIFAKSSGLGVGDTYHAYLYTIADVLPVVDAARAAGRAPTDAELRPFMTPVDFHITGVARASSDIVVNEKDSSDTVIATPAFVRKYGSRAILGSVAVTLRDPAHDAAAFEHAVRRTLPNMNLDISATATQRSTFARIVGPYADALRLFALIAAITGLFVVGQALTRLVTSDSEDLDTLNALGATRRQRLSACSTRAFVALALGAGLALLGAYLTSAMFPIGRARDAEPVPGLRFDSSVLVLGGGALVLVLLVPLAVTAYTRVRGQSVRSVQAPFVPSRFASSLGRAGASLGATTGVRFAVQRDRSGRGSSLVATLVGLVAAIAAIAAALTFAANLNDLVTKPTRYGWTWGAFIDSYTEEVTPAFAGRIENDRDLAAITVGSRASLVMAGHTIPAYGFRSVRGRVAPAVVHGRMPRGAHEVAFGAQTLRDIDRSVGDTVNVPTGAGTPVRLKIVGQVLLPSLAVTGTSGLGEGAALDAAALRRIDPSAGPAFFLVDLAPGASVSALATRYGSEANVFGPRRPGDVVAYGHVRATPLLLAALLGVLGAGVLAHLLVTSIGSRRRDLAVLKTLGFTRRQVASTVAWLATTLIGLALLVGMPVGMIAGRWTWRSFADDLGISADVAVPLVALVVLVAVAILLANLVAALPARTAARTRPALVLRSE